MDEFTKQLTWAYFVGVVAVCCGFFYLGAWYMFGGLALILVIGEICRNRLPKVEGTLLILSVLFIPASLIYAIYKLIQWSISLV